MIIRGIVDDTPASISLTPASLTASLDDRFVAAWDRGGRLYTVFDSSGTLFPSIGTARYGLNGRVLVKERAEHGARRRRWAGDAEREAILSRAASFASSLFGNLARRADGELEAVLRRAAAFDARAAAEDAAAFNRVYQPVGILPPDQYLALVLQATEGCSFDSCTFCDFYRIPYRVKTAADFAEHVTRVREYLGESIRLRSRGIFIGSANALAVPMTGLRPMFDIVNAEFAGWPIHAFVDGFTGIRKTAADYAELGQRGLRRLYIGLESGHDPLLAFVQKPATAVEAVDTVHAIKDGHVAVGVIVLIGLGGTRFAADHVTDTARAVNAMKLGAGDFLFFSEIVNAPGSPYEQSMRERDVEPLSQEECVAQRRAIEALLEFEGPPPKIAAYDVREFIY